MQKILHHINGQQTAGSSSRLFDVYDPARGVVTKQVVLADATDVESAINAATDAFAAWRDIGLGVILALFVVLLPRSLMGLMAASHSGLNRQPPKASK